MTNPHGPLRVGVGGPVGSGKTALMDALCKQLRDRYEIAAITNDIYTKWDAEYLVRSGALAPERIAGVETGGCPHTAIREDASINLAAVAQMQKKFPALDPRADRVRGRQSGGDLLAELADLTIYVIDVAAGDKIPSKGGPGITRSDLLVINKVDLAPHVGASLEVMERDARRMRGARPFVFSNLRAGDGAAAIARFIEDKGGLAASAGLVARGDCAETRARSWGLQCGCVRGPEGARSVGYAASPNPNAVATGRTTCHAITGRREFHHAYGRCRRR